MDACNRPECLGGTRSDAAVVGGGLGQSPFREHTVLCLHGLELLICATAANNWPRAHAAISTTISHRFHQLRWLGSFVFFDRDVVARSDQAAFVRTVYQLSTFHPRVGISATIRCTPSICHGPSCNSKSSLMKVQLMMLSSDNPAGVRDSNPNTDHRQ